MKLGLLADIHESNENLRAALDRFRAEGVDQVVVLGDLFEMGERIEETCRLLREAGAMGVWGNHDFGLCSDPDERTRHKYAASVLDFMTGLRPRLEVDGCLFTHVEPWLDPEDISDLWYFDGPPDTPEKAAKSFEAVPHRFMFVGHVHRWLIARPGVILGWAGEKPIRLDGDNRYLILVAAVCDGKFAIFDSDTLELVPFG
jgi:hypothetical protein